MSLSFADISLCGQATNEGRLEVSPDYVIWTPRAGDGGSAGKRTVDLRKLSTASWTDVGRTCQLFLRDKEGGLLRFEGFKSTDFEAVDNAIASSRAGVKLEKMKMGVKGGNWGDWEINGKQLEWREIVLDDDGEVTVGNLVASIPLETIAQAQSMAKGDIDIQFLEDDLAEREDEVLVEMRLHVPKGHKIRNQANKTKAEEALKKKKEAAAARKKGGSSAMDEDGGAGGEEDGEEGGGAVVDSADGFVSAHQLSALISEAAGVAGVTGDAIVEFPESTVGQFLVPRGRYGIELYPQFARLVGKTYEFKVAYKAISRMFYLPKPPVGGASGEVTRYFFVISLEDPLKIGAQRHNHLVLQLDKQQASFDINVTDEEIEKKAYGGLGAESKTAEGDLPRVVAMLFKQITDKPIFKPGAFVSAAGGKSQAVRCTHKSNDGLLYPLEKSLMFVHKPTLWLRQSDIESVEFRKAAATSSSFELQVMTKDGKEYTFQSLDKGEYQPLKGYLEERGLRVKEAAHGGGKINYAEMDLGTDEDENDEDASGDSDDDDDDDSEDDESYHGEEDSDDDEDGKKKKKKKKDEGKGGKKEKEEKSGKKRKRAKSDSEDDDDDDSDASGGGSGDDDEDEGFKKKSKKKAPAKKKPAKKKAKKGSDDDDE